MGDGSEDSFVMEDIAYEVELSLTETEVRKLQSHRFLSKLIATSDQRIGQVPVATSSICRLLCLQGNEFEEEVQSAIATDSAADKVSPVSRCG